MGLVLTRKYNERIMINNGEIIIKVAGINPHTVKLHIEAPADVVIDREEIYLRKLEGIPND